VVVINPLNGEILAATSHPDYNPNLFAGGILPENWKVLSQDYRHPLQNRVIQSQYPPGSVYKLVTATAGLAEGVIDRNSSFICRGHYWFGGRFYRCWKKGGHGKVSVHRAIVESCDIFFYQLGEMLGIDTIARYARKLGLGRQTGLGLPGEWSGLIPDSVWKKKVRGEIWYPGETLSASIGQGYNLVTPIQGAVLISAIANGGDIYRPMLVRSVVSPEGKVIEEFYPEKLSQAEIRPWVLEVVRKGMKGAVNEAHGTGWRARLEQVEVAGKTGTAQVIRMGVDEEEKELEEIPEKFRDHAWFGCYAPAEDPRVVIVVLMEHGGHGGSASAPVAAEILKEMVRKNYFGSTDGES
jgi:penicillin-binding protein 2